MIYFGLQDGSIPLGALHLGWSVVDGQKSGVERKRLSEQTQSGYIHASFVRYDAAKIVQEKLGQELDEDRIKQQLENVLEKDREERDLLIARVSSLEKQLSVAKTRTKAKVARNILVLEQQIAAVSQEMTKLTHLLRLMEEDIIILAAVA